MTEVLKKIWPFNQLKPFLDYIAIECGLSDNTVKAYTADLQRFTHFCQLNDIVRPSQVNMLNLQQYTKYLAQTDFGSGLLAPTSIARHIVTLRMFLRFNMINGLIKKDICSALESPRPWHRLPRVIGQQATLTLVEAVDPASPYFLRDRALLELLYATGMRASEIADVKLKDINFKIGYLLCIGKGHKERVIPVHQIALDLINQYVDQLRIKLDKHQHPQLFLSRTGCPLDRVDIWRIVKKAARMTGFMGNITPHTLRHCFGTHLLQGGADLRSVQEMLGHANVTTTQIYTYVDNSHLKKNHKKYHPRP